MKQKNISFILAAVFTMVGILPAALAAPTSAAQATSPAPAAQSVGSNPQQLESVIAAPSDRNRLSEYVQLSPMMGFTAISGTAGFNLGASAAFRLTDRAPLFFEPVFMMGIFTSAAQFSIDPGMRYDVTIPDTKVLPFVHLALGPTFETSGSNPVFNAMFGPGVTIPARSDMDVRIEANFVDIDGNAGFELLGGVTL